MTKNGAFCGFSFMVMVLCGCDPVTTHKITSTIFDGVPSLPPAEQYCREYHEAKLTEEAEAAKKKMAALEIDARSEHEPYAKKRCSDCHDKMAEGGLVRPKKELCFVCHDRALVAGAFAHGPAATGACLECHEPHSSSSPKLLKLPNGKLCATCHKEQRLALRLHREAGAKGMTCTDCHDPHSSPARYLLR
jgi:predicted CXXCH cytochrome family protein